MLVHTSNQSWTEEAGGWHSSLEHGWLGGGTVQINRYLHKLGTVDTGWAGRGPMHTSPRSSPTAFAPKLWQGLKRETTSSPVSLPIWIYELAGELAKAQQAQKLPTFLSIQRSQSSWKGLFKQTITIMYEHAWLQRNQCYLPDFESVTPSSILRTLSVNSPHLSLHCIKLRQH